MNSHMLPAFNAVMNSISTVLLITGWILIRKGRKKEHAICMVSALTTSAIFLVGYLIHKYFNSTTKFVNPAWARPLYLWILVPHLILAIAMLPLIFKTVWHASRKEWDKHRRIARWTLPVWLYVSVTGVVVYFILYQWFPQG